MTVKVEFYDDLQATAERIWDVLTGVEHYSESVEDISWVDPPPVPRRRTPPFASSFRG
jgi:hypothetical protein